jgi:hypothetical protein
MADDGYAFGRELGDRVEAAGAVEGIAADYQVFVRGAQIILIGAVLAVDEPDLNETVARRADARRSIPTRGSLGARGPRPDRPRQTAARCDDLNAFRVACASEQAAPGSLSRRPWRRDSPGPVSTAPLAESQ